MGGSINRTANDVQSQLLIGPLSKQLGGRLQEDVLTLPSGERTYETYPDRLRLWCGQASQFIKPPRITRTGTELIQVDHIVDHSDRHQLEHAQCVVADRLRNGDRSGDTAGSPT